MILGEDLDTEGEAKRQLQGLFDVQSNIDTQMYKDTQEELCLIHEHLCLFLICLLHPSS